MITQIVLYQEGHWNNGSTFSYDLSDPLGRQKNSQLLSTYLDTRKGNCVSMPTLYWALLERVDADLQVYAAEAPQHVFLRMRDRQRDLWVNMETTNGHTARDQWIREQTGVTDNHVAIGLYMRNLGKKAFLAVLLRSFEQHLMLVGELDRALRLNQLMRALDPESLQVLVNRGALLHMRANRILDRARQSGVALSAAERAAVKRDGNEGDRLLAEARGRGWQPGKVSQKADRNPSQGPSKQK